MTARATAPPGGQVPGYVSLWLEAQGYGRTLRTLQAGSRLYMRYLVYGLGLAAALQVLHAGFALFLPR